MPRWPGRFLLHFPFVRAADSLLSQAEGHSYPSSCIFRKIAR
jgi:hypothetical protein